MVVDGASVAGLAYGPPPGDLRALLLAFYPDAEIPPIEHADDGAAPMVAEVNHGTWIAPCECAPPSPGIVPSPGCIVWLDLPWGWCIRCSNAAAGGRWRPVVLPSERAAIESILALRPDPGSRNWAPGETVADLIAENAAHGIEAR